MQMNVRGFFKPCVVVILLSTFGCALAPSNVSFPNKASISDTEVKFEQCQVSARFRGYPRQLTPQELIALTRPLSGPLKWDVVGYGFDEPLLAEVAVCMCRDLAFGARDMEQFRVAMQDNKNMSFVASLKADYSKYILQYQSVASPGDMIDSTQFTYPTTANKCILVQSVWAEKSNSDAVQAFFATTRGMASDALQGASVPVTRGNANSVADRLDQLIQLRSQNLISQDEYDKKRKQIIDGL